MVFGVNRLGFGGGRDRKPFVQFLRVCVHHGQDSTLGFIPNFFFLAAKATAFPGLLRRVSPCFLLEEWRLWPALKERECNCNCKTV